MSLPIDERHGIQFFDNAPSCISHFEKMHWTKKAVSLIQSFGTLFIYALNRVSLVFYRVDAEMNRLTNNDDNRLSKERLVVCIHGLNNNPTQFKKIIDEMDKKDLSHTDIFIPRVLQKGNAKLDEMVSPILDEIEKWATIGKSGKKELVLVGISNGGRISRAILAHLAKSESIKKIKKLHFVSIVGACKGSSLVNFAHKVGLSWLMSKNISEEMAVNSERNKRLDNDWEEGLSKGPERKYTFFASPHDWQVTNYDSSLMVVDRNAHYCIVRGQGHNSIVNAVAKPVAELILT